MLFLGGVEGEILISNSEISSMYTLDSIHIFTAKKLSVFSETILSGKLKKNIHEKYKWNRIFVIVPNMRSLPNTNILPTNCLASLVIIVPWNLGLLVPFKTQMKGSILIFFYVKCSSLTGYRQRKSVFCHVVFAMFYMNNIHKPVFWGGGGLLYNYVVFIITCIKGISLMWVFHFKSKYFLWSVSFNIWQ